MRDRSKAGTRGKLQKLYAVYDAVSDELLAFGTSEECTRLLGIKNIATFYEICSRVFRGKNVKYAIVVMDDSEEEGE